MRPWIFRPQGPRGRPLRPGAVQGGAQGPSNGICGKDFYWRPGAVQWYCVLTARPYYKILTGLYALGPCSCSCDPCVSVVILAQSHFGFRLWPRTRPRGRTFPEFQSALPAALFRGPWRAARRRRHLSRSRSRRPGHHPRGCGHIGSDGLRHPPRHDPRRRRQRPSPRRLRRSRPTTSTRSTRSTRSTSPMQPLLIA